MTIKIEKTRNSFFSKNLLKYRRPRERFPASSSSIGPMKAVTYNLEEERMEKKYLGQVEIEEAKGNFVQEFKGLKGSFEILIKGTPESFQEHQGSITAAVTLLKIEHAHPDFRRFEGEKMESIPGYIYPGPRIIISGKIPALYDLTLDASSDWHELHIQGSFEKSFLLIRNSVRFSGSAKII